MSGNGPRVAVDARPLSQGRYGGFRSYLRALVAGLGEMEPDSAPSVLLYLDRPLPRDVEAALPSCCETRVLSPDRLRVDLCYFTQQVRRDAPDLVHGTTNYLPRLPRRTPATVTLHDALGAGQWPWDRKTPRTPRERLLHAYWTVQTRRATNEARNVVTVSHGAAADIVATGLCPSERITVIYNGVLPPHPCAIAQAAPEREPQRILTFASSDPRKNFAVVCRALGDERLASRRTSHCLDVVCAADKPYQLAKTLIHTLMPNQPCHLHLVPDDRELSMLYARSSVFVWPSRREGFGLPPLEAMRHAVPVVASHAPAMPEILGDAALYADPDREDEFAERILTLLNDDAERLRRARLGHARAATFTCRRMAEETVAVWRKALSA